MVTAFVLLFVYESQRNTMTRKYLLIVQTVLCRPQSSVVHLLWLISLIMNTIYTSLNIKGIVWIPSIHHLIWKVLYEYHLYITEYKRYCMNTIYTSLNIKGTPFHLIAENQNFLRFLPWPGREPSSKKNTTRTHWTLAYDYRAVRHMVIFMAHGVWAIIVIKYES